MSKYERYIISHTVLTGVALHVFWTVLEFCIYGEVQPRSVDTAMYFVMCLIISVMWHFKFKRDQEKRKKVIPEIVASINYEQLEEPLLEYRCEECGFHVIEDYLYCPYCGSELDFNHLSEASEVFKEAVIKYKKERMERHGMAKNK